MSTIALTLQNVNGDPFIKGDKANINITRGTTFDAVFKETAGALSLSTVQINDTVTIAGSTYSYDYLGSGDVRGDPNQSAAFIRITTTPLDGQLSVGQTFAIDLTGQPGDPEYPSLPNGNTRLKLADLDTSTPTQFPGVPCFAAGTAIQTAHGDVVIEEIQVGDHILTMDAGYQKVRWIGERYLGKAELEANPKLTPIRINAGALGAGKPETDLLISPQHRVLVRSKIAERMFDNIEVLVPANKLITIDGIDVAVDVQDVEYFHLLFDAHQILFSNGAPTESMLTGPEALRSVSPDARIEIETLLPEITAPEFAPVSARPIPEKGKRVKVMAERHQKNDQPLLQAS